MTSARAPLRVLVVDDHPVVRRGMASLLSGEDWVGQVSEAGTLAQARMLAVTERPDVALVDLGLPDGDGAELVRDIPRAVPGCAVLVVTMTNDPGLVETVLEAGARGYVVKDSSPEAILGAVQAVAAGGLVLGPGVDAARGGSGGTGGGAGSAGGTGGGRRDAGPLAALTPRERQVLALLTAGRSNREIARQLGLSEKTVRNQVSLVVAKLGVADRVQAALVAYRAGLTP